ncbi:Rpp14/Pop5 family-domain-containing protein [Xylariales sp. AK1849]|nr:Rpp14/Pop5 family-domain-containing protein [Xylariales sp. AK1849]
MVRIKERYLLVNILYPSEIGTKPNLPDVVVVNQPTTDKLNHQSLLRGIRDEVASVFGDYGSGAIGSLQVKYLSTATSTFILRINRAHYRLVWTALTLMDHVPAKNGKPCTFRVVHVSGTIRRVEEEAIRRARDLMLAVKDQAGAKDNGALATLLGETKRARQPTVLPVALDVGNGSGDEKMEDYYSDG